MSRSSPGRYALHEFAKNVLDVRATDAAGRPLPIAHPNPHQWDVTGHSGEVRVSYRVFGDRVDGTYLAIDSTPCPHQHAGGDHVGAGLRRAADQRPVRAAARRVVACGHAAAAGPRFADLYRAQPAVPDGQPGGVQRVFAADLHRLRSRAGHRCSGSPPITPARTRISTRWCATSRRIVRETRYRLRRVSSV